MDNISGNPEVKICCWKYNAPFAYSMTYDEGTVDCLANAYPIHKEFDFPGHVDVVAGQLGRPRNAFLSSLNDYVHMSKDELEYLIKNGWGIGNHSWSHFVYPNSPGLDLYREVVWSKYHLEDELNIPIRIFTICNDMNNYEPIIDMVKKHYLACAAVDGGTNRTNFDLYKIGNFMVASGKIRKRKTPPGWPEELLTDNLTLEYLNGSWLYETTHLVMWNVPQSHKCMTPEALSKRFSKIIEISKGKVWAAKPDDVIDYELMKRNIHITSVSTENDFLAIEVSGNWPVGIINSYLTIEIRGLKITEITKNHVIHELREPNKYDGVFNLCRNIESIKKENNNFYITMQLTPISTIKILTK